MWIQRTPEEIAKWQKAAEGEACSHGRLIGGIVWLLVAAFSAGGCFFFLSSGNGIVGQREVSGSFLLRLPIFGLIAAPFAYFIFRYERKKELAKITRRTICPLCDTPAEGNTGAARKCGGLFVPSSTMKWVE
jgi:hypothetical protein